MLLCPNCHKRIDDLQPDAFTAELLMDMKERHLSHTSDAWRPDERLISAVAEDMVSFCIGRLRQRGVTEVEDEIEDHEMGSSGIGYQSDTVGPIEARQMWLESRSSSDRLVAANVRHGSGTVPLSVLAKVAGAKVGRVEATLDGATSETQATFTDPSIPPSDGELDGPEPIAFETLSDAQQNGLVRSHTIEVGSVGPIDDLTEDDRRRVAEEYIVEHGTGVFVEPDEDTVGERGRTR